MRAAAGLLVLLLLSFAAHSAWARGALDLDVAQEPVELRDAGETWIDSQPDRTAEQVAADPSIAWRPTHQHAIYRLNTGKALWIRFTVPPTAGTERWYLEIPYPSVDRVTLSMQARAGHWTQQVAGDTVAVAAWPVPHRHPLMPIHASPDEPRHYLLKVQNGHSFSAPLTFVSDSYLSLQEQRTSLILGIYFGLAALAATLAVLSAVSLRDSAYAWYAFTVALMGLSQAAMTGIAGLHLWPWLPWWNDRSSLVLPLFAVAGLQGFVTAVVSMQERSRTLYWVLMGTAVASVPAAAAVLFIEPSYRFAIMVPYIVVSMNIAMGATIWAARRGDRFAWGLLAGSAPVVLGSLFPLARTAGLIPVSFWTMHGMQIGIAFELPILLVILMLRSQSRRENRRRIQKMDRIDPATGLINDHVFHERLVHMMARSVRLKYRSAVLLIEIANIDAIRRDFGRAAADELPLRVASRLLHAAREIDSVGRLAEHRFGMLLEGPLTASEVAEAGPRVVARCLMPYRNRPLEWVAQARVAQALVPMDGTDPDDILERLHLLLAQVPADSKRSVFNLGPVAPASAGVLV